MYFDRRQFSPLLLLILAEVKEIKKEGKLKKTNKQEQAFSLQEVFWRSFVSYKYCLIFFLKIRASNLNIILIS